MIHELITPSCGEFFSYISLIIFIKMLASTYLEYTKNRYSMLAIIVENT